MDGVILYLVFCEEEKKSEREKAFLMKTRTLVCTRSTTNTTTRKQ